MNSEAPNERIWSPLFGWFALLVVGQAAALTLIRAGRVVGYQHYDVFGLVRSARAGFAAIVLLAQAVLVIRTSAPVWAWLGSVRRGRSPLTFIAIAIVLFGLSAVPSLSIGQYVAELALAFGIQVVAILNVGCLVRSAPEALLQRWRRVCDYWLGTDAGDAPVPGRFFDRTATIAAAWSFVVTLFLAIVVYQRIPHLPDEIVYELQARYFAAGQIALPVPSAPRAFDIDLMYLRGDKWFSMAPPGWPALLALGVSAGVPWMVNPILAALAVLLVHKVLREVYPARAARGATILLALSPWYLFLGMSLMGHLASLVCALLAALGVAYSRRRGLTWPSFLGGLALGAVSLVRPLEGLAVALILGFWSLGARGRHWRLTPSIALVFGTVLTAILVAPYNAGLTGSPTRFPFSEYSDTYYARGANDLGFGPNRGLGWETLDPFPGHGLRDVVLNSVLNGATINVELFGWITGSLIFVAALFAVGRLTRADWRMIVVALVVVGLHAFYWFSGGPDFAGRYWFLTIVPLCALTVSGVRALAAGDATRQARVSLGVAALCTAAIVTFIPWRAVDKYWHFRRMEPGLAGLVRAHNMTGLVLVRGRRHPDYHGAAIFNPLDLRNGSTVFAWDRDRAIREEVVRAYPDRPVWIVDGPSVTRRGYELRAGPLPAGSLARDLPTSDDLEMTTSRDRAR